MNNDGSVAQHRAKYNIFSIAQDRENSAIWHWTREQGCNRFRSHERFTGPAQAIDAATEVARSYSPARVEIPAHINDMIEVERVATAYQAGVAA